jgi:hypothetical protein
VAGRRGRHRTHGAAAAAADQRRPADRERRFGGLGSRWRRDRGRLARARAAASPHHRSDARRAHAAIPADVGRTADTGDAANRDADGVDPAGADAVHAGARAAVLVAVPPSAPVAEPAMELSPGRQRLLFVVVVIALVALGIFVIRGRSDGNSAAPPANPTPPASAPATSGAATGSPAATSSPPASSPPASSTATGGATNIYQWLPFTESDLSTAAKTTVAFANVYANTSYTETKAAYAAKLAGLTTSQEAATLVSDFESPELAATRTADKQVATGTPTIVSISSFGPEPPEPPGSPSITFAVTIAQKLASTTGTITSTPEYTITIVSTATGWQVENIQLASLGNQ